MTAEDRKVAADLDRRISEFVYDLAGRIGRHEYAALTISHSAGGCKITVDYPERLLAAPASGVAEQQEG